MSKWVCLYTLPHYCPVCTLILAPISFWQILTSLRHEKTYLEKLDGRALKPRGRHLYRPWRPFWGPLAAILNFAGGAALQAVTECPRRRYAGIEQLPRFSSVLITKSIQSNLINLIKLNKSNKI